MTLVVPELRLTDGQSRGEIVEDVHRICWEQQERAEVFPSDEDPVGLGLPGKRFDKDVAVRCVARHGRGEKWLVGTWWGHGTPYARSVSGSVSWPFLR